MDSPLRQWIRRQGWSDAKLARAAGVSRALVNAVAVGDLPLRGTFRTFVLGVDPQLVAAHDDWRDVRAAKDKADVEAAA